MEAPSLALNHVLRSAKTESLPRHRFFKMDATRYYHPPCGAAHPAIMRRGRTLGLGPSNLSFDAEGIGVKGLCWESAGGYLGASSLVADGCHPGLE